MLLFFGIHHKTHANVSLFNILLDTIGAAGLCSQEEPPNQSSPHH